MASEMKIEDISPVEKKLSFEVIWDDVKKELDSIYKTVGKSAKVRGFRPGKAPRAILELHYGESVKEEAISKLVTKHYTEAVEKNDIEVVAQPVIDNKGITVGEDFLFTATVEIQPVLDPKDYTGLDLEKEKLTITKADVEEKLTQIRQMYATLEDVTDDRALADGDFALIDFAGTLNGEARKELAAEGHTLQIGSKSFVPGFEEQLIGMKKGEAKDVAVTFPETYGAKDIAGKEVLFSVTLKNIREKLLPELDEDFIKNFEKYETLKDLREDVKKSLEDEGEARIKAELRGAIVDKLLEKNEFEVPSVWVNQQIYTMMIDARRRMVQNGMPDDKAAEMTYNLHDMFKDQAEKIVKASFILSKIAKKESMEVGEEEVEEKLRELAQRYGQDYEAVKKVSENNDMKERLRDELLEQKALNFIEEKATITALKKSKKKEKGEE
ncbi:MAG: trigger factor [Syntrophales bacterium]|nr:trigger factor [Syntrophales bacterium]